MGVLFRSNTIRKIRHQGSELHISGDFGLARLMEQVARSETMSGVHEHRDSVQFFDMHLSLSIVFSRMSKISTS